MKKRRQYICQSCGHQEPKWLGRCLSCGEWSSFVEEVVNRSSKQAKAEKVLSSVEPLSGINLDNNGNRTLIGIPELDLVLGGGLVTGALTLVGGDPGIGKSTLLLQAMGKLASSGHTVLYMSAEESLHQIKVRANRLGIDSEGNVKYNLQDPSPNSYSPITSVEEENGVLYFGSLDYSGIAYIKHPE